jgi:error-prone DNA polymerase
MLCNHSYFSLRYGTVNPEELLSLAIDGGYDAFAITDINCTAGVIEFFRLAEKKNFHAVAGIDFRNGVDRKYIGIAKNEEGFYELNVHLSRHLHEEKSFDSKAPVFPNAFVIYPYSDKLDINSLRENEYIGIAPRDLVRLKFSGTHIQKEKMVALNTATFRNKRDFNAHRLLRAIDNNTLLSKLPKSEEGGEKDLFLTCDELDKIYVEFPELVENAKQLLQHCKLSFDFDQKKSKNQMFYRTSEEEDNALLKQLCEEGMQYRYPHATTKEWKRLNTELKVIKQQGFVPYFLINWDIVRYARSRGNFYVGRGSGANSLVAYLIGITDVDPIELDLYFERFINLFRKNPPDFDIDFSWRDREDITRYIFERFDNVALMGAFSTFQYSATIRELGKVFGLPKEEIDMLASESVDINKLDSIQRLVIIYSHYIHNFPNYITVHSSGIIITEKNVHHYGATFFPPKGYTTTQFDMHQAEDISINKLDILSQRGLEKIKDTLKIVRENEGVEIDIHDINRFKHDEGCNQLLKDADTIGCFYIESPAMRMLLTKLQTHDYIGLVAASSVIRPGVASSGMMSEYIRRERNTEMRKNAPKPLLDLMPETHGVMVYQEDVIKVAHYFAGLDLGEADVLRRGMSGKYRGREEFQLAKQRFIEGALQQGHSNKLVQDVWRQVESFAGYAFAKGHSASYAVESYQCLYLKRYYPLAYMTATINNFGGYYRTEFYIHEARMKGATIHAPCVNISFDGAVLKGTDITLGLILVKELTEETRNSIVHARAEGVFASLDDFLERTHITLDQALILARVGALRFTGMSKKELMWQLHLRLSKSKKMMQDLSLFSVGAKSIELPQLEHHSLEDAYDEMEILGFPLCSPFDLLDEQVEEECLSKDFPQRLFANTHKEITAIGYKITTKTTNTRTGERMMFGNFLDRKGRFIDTVHFPDVAQKYPFSGWGLFLIKGKLTEDYGAITLEVTSIRRLKLKPDPRVGTSARLK